MSKLPRFLCPWCGKECAGYVPRGGDGTGYRLRWHRPNGKDPCRGSYYVAKFDEEVKP